MNHVFLVAVGGALGAAMRYLSGMAALRLLGPNFPWNTIFVNVSGSLAMGLLVAWLARRSAGDDLLRVFLATGVLGGFTTFSAFSLDVAILYERGDLGLAFAYVLGSVTLSVAALFAGLWLMRAA
jgi:fluoride exporter